jgi:hypothetical protein
MGESNGRAAIRQAGRRFPRPGAIPARVSCISSLSARGRGVEPLNCTHRNATTHREPQMITAYFAFVTAAFFVAVLANVAASVAGATA